MIVAFDGNVYTGKTTLIKLLSEKYGYNPIDEHSFFVDLSDMKEPDRSTIDVQERYIGVDIFRKKFVHGEINLLDRSFVSVSAHVYALFRLGIEDIRKNYLDLLRKKVSEILIPDRFVFVCCDYDTSQKRCVSVNNDKKTDALLLSREYFECIAKFNEKWISMVNGCMVKAESGFTDEWLSCVQEEVFKKTPPQQLDVTMIFQLIYACMESPLDL